MNFDSLRGHPIPDEPGDDDIECAFDIVIGHVLPGNAAVSAAAEGMVAEMRDRGVVRSGMSWNEIKAALETHVASLGFSSVHEFILFCGG
jgi:hypothetical protein